MEKLQFNYNDGGRSIYFRGKRVGDCCVRAAAIASGRDYMEVYKMAQNLSGESPRNGMKTKDCKALMEALGGVWEPFMKIGSGCKVHMRPGEVPTGRVVCRLSGHMVAVIDGVVNDTYEDDRCGTRCIYGVWRFPDI